MNQGHCQIFSLYNLSKNPVNETPALLNKSVYVFFLIWLEISYKGLTVAAIVNSPLWTGHE